jgi:DNA-binding XRE family transcriptional regulator
MPLANMKREVAARMTAEDCEPDDRVAAAVGVSQRTIAQWNKGIDEIDLEWPTRRQG